MLSRLAGAVWRADEAGEEEEEEEEASSWPRSAMADQSSSRGDDISLPCLKSILDDDWYAPASSSSLSHHPFADPSLLLPPPPPPPPLPPVDSSTCSPSSSVFSLDPSSSSFHPKPAALSSFLSAVCSNPPYDSSAFDFVSENPTFLPPPNPFAAGMLGFSQDLLPMGCLNPPPMGGGGGGGFDSFESSSPFLGRGKVLRPLEIFPPVGAQPTLFQKRALRQNGEKGMCLLGGQGRSSWDCEIEKRRRINDEDELDDGSIDGSGLNYDSEDVCEVGETLRVDQEKNVSVANSSLSAGGGGGELKGRRKGLPAKNLMAERRRRKKLNDRLYMLRSVVPKISKMDRASILGDAIEYLKELLQRINDLHNELESTNSSLPTSGTSSFHPLTPTPPTLPCRIKEELCPSSLPSPNGQPARVEVRLREGRAVNIHMFCARRPGLLLSTMRALDGLGLDIQQAVISCFNGFALDVFRAEQSKDGPGVLPEEIKEVLLHSAGFQNAL